MTYPCLSSYKKSAGVFRARLDIENLNEPVIIDEDGNEHEHTADFEKAVTTVCKSIAATNDKNPGSVPYTVEIYEYSYLNIDHRSVVNTLFKIVDSVESVEDESVEDESVDDDNMDDDNMDDDNMDDDNMDDDNMDDTSESDSGRIIKTQLILGMESTCRQGPFYGTGKLRIQEFYANFKARDAFDFSKDFLGLDITDRKSLFAVYKKVVSDRNPELEDFLDILTVKVSLEVAEKFGPGMSFVVAINDDIEHLQYMEFAISVNSDGRITHLKLFPEYCEEPWDMHADIVHMDQLTHLEINRCRSFPSFSKLIKLEELKLVDCGQLLKDIPAQMSPCFRNVKRFSVSDMKEPPSLSFLTSLQLHLPRVESVSFAECKMEEDHLEPILFGLVPYVTSIRELNLEWNNIKSLQTIAKRTPKRDEEGIVLDSGLRLLNLNGNPITHSGDRQEVDAVCDFLRAFPTIQDIFGNPGLYWHHPKVFCHPSIHFAIHLNRVGRRLLRNNFLFPLAAWPLVLAKANKPTNVPKLLDSGQKARSASILYHFLREGPVLFSQLPKQKRGRGRKRALPSPNLLRKKQK